MAVPTLEQGRVRVTPDEEILQILTPERKTDIVLSDPNVDKTGESRAVAKNKKMSSRNSMLESGTTRFRDGEEDHCTELDESESIQKIKIKKNVQCNERPLIECGPSESETESESESEESKASPSFTTQVKDTTVTMKDILRSTAIGVGINLLKDTIKAPESSSESDHTIESSEESGSNNGDNSSNNTESLDASSSEGDEDNEDDDEDVVEDK